MAPQAPLNTSKALSNITSKLTGCLFLAWSYPTSTQQLAVYTQPCPIVAQHILSAQSATSSAYGNQLFLNNISALRNSPAPTQGCLLPYKSTLMLIHSSANFNAQVSLFMSISRWAIDYLLLANSSVPGPCTLNLISADWFSMATAQASSYLNLQQLPRFSRVDAYSSVFFLFLLSRVLFTSSSRINEIEKSPKQKQFMPILAYTPASSYNKSRWSTSD